MIERKRLWEGCVPGPILPMRSRPRPDALGGHVQPPKEPKTFVFRPFPRGEGKPPPLSAGKERLSNHVVKRPYLGKDGSVQTSREGLKPVPYRFTYIAMAHAITMRELQKLSATSIERLRGAVPVQSDGRTVALLVPLRPASEEARARFRRVLAQAQAQRSPEEQAALDREFGP